jgi:hypothetical protein
VVGASDLCGVVGMCFLERTICFPSSIGVAMYRAVAEDNLFRKTSAMDFQIVVQVKL